jgi:hypothetical protein
MRRLELALYAGSVARAPGETLVVPIPADERPLAGDAGWVDWRLCGEISRRLATGEIAGGVGEALLFPARPPIRAERVLVLGLGPSRELAGRPLLRGFRELAGRLLGLRCACAVLALPGAIDLELDGDLCLRGALEALSGARESDRLRLVLPEAERRIAALKSALAAVAPDAERLRVSLQVRWVEAEDLTHRFVS